MFDDPRVGLVREPFVAGIPAMMDKLVREITNAENGFRLNTVRHTLCFPDV